MQRIHNTKRNKHTLLARALSIAFALTMCLTPLSPVTVHADNVNADVGGGGTGNMQDSANYKAWYNSHQGYRFYIINSDLVRVTAVYDFYFTAPTGVTEILKTTRFDGPSSPNAWNSASISDLAALTGSSVSDIPRPVKDNAGHGEEFKQWFLRNAHGLGGGSIGIGAVDTDSDGDGILDSKDADRDGDGIPNTSDPQPDCKCNCGAGQTCTYSNCTSKCKCGCKSSTGNNNEDIKTKEETGATGGATGGQSVV